MNPRLWFFDNSVNIFPIDIRDKAPIVPRGTSQFDYRPSRQDAEKMRDYGVSLGLLGVADSDSLEAERWLAANLPDTPFKVATGPYHDGSLGRGLHRYYRIVGEPPHFIHRAGHTIEFRHQGQYVVGPGSRHKAGIIYTAAEWSWSILDIPIFPSDFLFDDGSCGTFSTAGEPYEFPETVSAGRRHDELFRLLRSWKGSGLDISETREIVHLANEARCHPPLIEDATFEKWFLRQWNKPDRPFKREIPDAPLEQTPVPDLDLDDPGDDI